MVGPVKYRKETSSQTAGPFLHIGLLPAQAGLELFEPATGHVLAGPDAQGARIMIEGRVFDGAGDAVRDALVEIWHADSRGRYPHAPLAHQESEAAGFTGWGRAATDFETGIFRFETIKPGPVPVPGGGIMAPHVNLWIAARGINTGLNTRMYFPDEKAANAEDPVLGRVVPPSRRATLISRAGKADPRPVYRFDIRLQGTEETVFFDI